MDRSYDGHVFVCLPVGYADWPHDASSLSPAKELADAVKSAQKKCGSGIKLKVTVCEALDGEAGDILFFPPKTSSVKGPTAFRGAALTAAGIDGFASLAFEASGSANEAMVGEPLEPISQVLTHKSTCSCF